ncbi:MAG: Hvo_1808 family surface protein [Halobacteria archaeon]|nr:Hvo_1808 family surface protein [Halobacteria archaeon]
MTHLNRSVVLVSLVVVLSLCLVPTASAEIGEVDGYSHDDRLDINTSDGLSDDEAEALVSRSMARVEYIRGVEFNSEIPVRSISRSEYRDRMSEREKGSNSNSNRNSTLSDWNNQVWEALFIVGENDDVTDEIHDVINSNVIGYYSPENDTVFLVSGASKIDGSTLVHELVHALQDQRGKLEEFRNTSRLTQDQQLASDAVIEGEANYIMYRYEERCGDGWNCLEGGSSSTSGSGSDVNLGVLMTMYEPYSDDPGYVASLVEDRDRNGYRWSRLEERYDDPPETTEEVIHLHLGGSDDVPEIEFNDTSSRNWSLYEHGYDTVGEASIHNMFWYQSYKYGVEATNTSDFRQPSRKYGIYRYVSRASAGWGNDRVYPYKTDGGGNGYVWKTVWDSESDADEFYDAYTEVLEGHGAERHGEAWVIPDGEFADAFHVTKDGKTVKIVNAPDVESLSQIDATITTGTSDSESESVSVGSDPDSGSGSGSDVSETVTNPISGVFPSDTTALTVSLVVFVAFIAVASLTALRR